MTTRKAAVKLGLVALIAAAALAVPAPRAASAFENTPCTRACVNNLNACEASCRARGLTGAALFACTAPCVQTELACIQTCQSEGM